MYRVHEMPTGDQLPPHYYSLCPQFSKYRNNKLYKVRRKIRTLSLPIYPHSDIFLKRNTFHNGHGNPGTTFLPMDPTNRRSMPDPHLNPHADI